MAGLGYWSNIPSTARRSISKRTTMQSDIGAVYGQWIGQRHHVHSSGAKCVGRVLWKDRPNCFRCNFSSFGLW